MQRYFSKRGLQILLATLAMTAITLPVIATPELWSWSDKSALLPVREGVSLNIVSERAGNWLLSDGSRLYKFNGETVKDLTSELRQRGAYGVSGILSDGQYWLVWYKPLDRNQPLVWFTDGEQWIEATDRFAYATGGLDAVGYQGTWYVRTYTKAESGRPATWTLHRWQGGQTQLEKLDLPLGNLTPFASGCVKDAGNSLMCTGVSTPLHVNGSWYFLGGTNQLRDVNGELKQAASTHIWKLEGNQWREIALPAVKFVSGVWQSEQGALIATSDAISNPFAADRFWLFDGQAVRDVSDQALGAGLLSMDAREIKASWNGRAWVILAGKQVIRFDGQRMMREKPTYDLFHALSSNESGVSVFVGAASTPESGVASSPLMGKLVVLEEDFSQASPTPTMTDLAQEIVSQAFGPRITTTSNPADLRIGHGKTFVFKAQTSADEEVERIDIYLNGGRVKSCFDIECTYAQTYLSQGELTRRMEFFARAVNRRGFANDSKPVTLIVDLNSTASAQTNESVTPPSTVVSEEAIPSNLPWTMDLGTGIAWAIWMTPAGQTVLKDQTVQYNVAARASHGLNRIEMWMNGSIKDNCVFDGVTTDIRACRVTLNPTDLPNNADVFVNARIVDSRDLETWSAGQNFHRERVNIKSTTVKTQSASEPVVKGPIFKASATLTPAVASVVRGDVVKYRVNAQNNTSGLHSIEILANGQVKNTCSFGAVVGSVPCELTLDTSTYQPGTTITFMGRAIDNRGQETWAEAKSVLVRATAEVNQNASAQTSSILNTWSWMSPEKDVIAVNETATYTVGAWSQSGIKTIEIIADGVIRKTCSFGNKGSKECAYTVTTNDFSDEHMVVINARVTAMDNTVTWSDIRVVTLKRTWNPLSNPAAYAQVSHNRPDGYVADDQVSFTLRGWSPRGLDRLELFVNGKKVFTCPAERCVWTTPAYNQPTLEYQLRMLDQGGQEAWSGVYGLRRK